MRPIPFLVALALAAALPGASQAAEGYREVKAVSADTEKKATIAEDEPEIGAPARDRSRAMRFRLGVLGRLAMQPTMFELGAGYDLPLASLPKRMKLALDLTAGMRTTIVHLIPMAGVRVQAFRQENGRLEGFGLAMGGLNMGIYRGSFGLGIPLRLGGGIGYRTSEKLSAGVEVAFDVGPLVAPFSTFQAGVHAGLGLEYRM